MQKKEKQLIFRHELKQPQKVRFRYEALIFENKFYGNLFVDFFGYISLFVSNFPLIYKAIHVGLLSKAIIVGFCLLKCWPNFPKLFIFMSYYN